MLFHMYTWKSYTAHMRHLAANTHFITINKAYRSTVRRDFVKLLKQETLEIMEVEAFSFTGYQDWVLFHQVDWTQGNCIEIQEMIEVSGNIFLRLRNI